MAFGEEGVFGSVAAAELVLSCGGELQMGVVIIIIRGVAMVVVVVEGDEFGDGFSGEFSGAFEDEVEVHHEFIRFGEAFLEHEEGDSYYVPHSL